MDVTRKPSVAVATARVALPVVGAVGALAAGVWFAAVGASFLSGVLGFAACLGLGLLLAARWAVNRTVAWLVALLFWLTIGVPGVDWGRDAVLAARGRHVAATVSGYRHAQGARSPTTYTILRTKDGRYLEVHAYVHGTGPGPVTVVVDPHGTVAPQVASDVTVGTDRAWSLAGLLVVLLAILGFGISAERDQRRGAGPSASESFPRTH